MYIISWIYRYIYIQLYVWIYSSLDFNYSRFILVIRPFVNRVWNWNLSRTESFGDCENRATSEQIYKAEKDRRKRRKKNPYSSQGNKKFVSGELNNDWISLQKTHARIYRAKTKNTFIRWSIFGRVHCRCARDAHSCEDWNRFVVLSDVDYCFLLYNY